MLQASLARILGLIVGLAILGGVSHSPEQTPAGELPITVTAAAATPNTCDPDTTCEGLEADTELTPAHEPWATTFICEHNTAGGFGGWVCTQDGITADHECVVHISAQPYRAIVVPDTSVMCDANATGYTQDTPVTACWVEHKVDLPDELIQGDPTLMPAGSTVVECGQA